MKFSSLYLVILLVVLVQSALGGLQYQLAWQVKSELGFSGPNEIRDLKTGQTRGIVVCDVGKGVVCFNPKGEQMWEYPLTPQATAYPAVGDVDGDGDEEIVACGGTGEIVLLSAKGQLIWSAHTPSAVKAESCPTIADLDGDGQAEILVGDTGGNVSCFDSKGKLRWRFRGDGTQMGPTLVADIYDSPGQEIIVTSHDRHIYALSDAGEWLWDIFRNDDLFPNSTPLLADVDGDDMPELYVGGGLHHFYRIDPKSRRIVLEENVLLHVNSAIAATDIDGDGKDEVVFGNKGGTARCYDESGFAWQQEFAKGNMSHSPVVVNLDEDPQLEIMFLFHILQALDADGSILLETSMPGNANSPPLAGDFDDDGMLDVVVAGFGMHGSNMISFLKFNVPYQENAAAWTVFTGNRAHTCQLASAKKFPLLPVPKQQKCESSARFSPYGDINLVSGANIWRFDVTNPDKDRLVLLTDVVYPSGTVSRFANHVMGENQRVAISLSTNGTGEYKMKQKLISADDNSILASSHTNVVYEGLTTDQQYLKNVVYKEIDRALQDWQSSNPTAANNIREKILAIQARVHSLEQTGDQLEVEALSGLIESGRRLRALAVTGQALAEKSSFFAWQFCPWAYFDPVATLPSPKDKTEALSAGLCVGEYESIALNLTNISSQTLDVRVRPTDFTGPQTASAYDHLSFRRAVAVPTLERQQIADALPLLDQGKLISIPSLESQQLWITLNAQGLKPGDYDSELHLKSLQPDPTEVILPLKIKVHDLALPKPRPLRFCVWAYAADWPEYGVKDLIDHGVTVHFGIPPKAICNSEGELIGDLDFSEHDASVERFSAHGMMLFLSPQNQLKGQPFLSDPWCRAFIKYLRLWVAHSQELGLDYRDWALYPYDEPSTPYAQTTVNLVKVAKLIREADANILIYTDPTSGTNMETVNMFKGLIDIWCPSSELLERFGDELLPIAKEVGKEVWFYDAAGRSRTLSPLGLYRWRFWYAWNLGLTGVGWWNYAWDEGHYWDGPNPSGEYYSTVYKAPGANVTSKRWEVAREGIEDYEILYLLKNKIQEAKDKGITGSALENAKQLLQTWPIKVETTLNETGRRIPLTPDSVPMYRQATEVVQEARHTIIQACLDLDETMK